MEFYDPFDKRTIDNDSDVFFKKFDDFNGKDLIEKFLNKSEVSQKDLSEGYYNPNFPNIIPNEFNSIFEEKSPKIKKNTDYFCFESPKSSSVFDGITKSFNKMISPPGLNNEFNFGNNVEREKSYVFPKKSKNHQQHSSLQFFQKNNLEKKNESLVYHYQHVNSNAKITKIKKIDSNLFPNENNFFCGNFRIIN